VPAGGIGEVIEIRRDSEIYDVEGGWFRARWHFSFDRYRDPSHDGFGAMRVFNDDRLIPGAIWPMHPHKDIEGLTYVVEGSFRHQDNVGGAPGPLSAGSVQRMTLGRGAWHSEQNASETEPMRFIQIWILPDTANLEPGVEQRAFTREDRADRLLRVIGPEGGDVVALHQDASVSVGSLGPEVSVRHEIGAGRGAYLYLIGGRANVNGQDLGTGDAAAVADEPAIEVTAVEQSEVILVDVPMTFEPVGVWAAK
jgi:redox-sensitive bicupin YhaK (pirin superfamily)